MSNSSIADQLRSSAVTVAPRLLGAVLASEVDGRAVRVRITEVEAYEGADDPASHAFRGSTSRTAVMFGPAGFLYCYFVYGMHWCANVVVGEPGQAAAVLLRAGAVVDGMPVVRERTRPTRTAAADDLVASGPARLARALGLRGEHTGLNLLDESSPVRLLALGPGADYRTGPRVGIRSAADRPWRFWLPDEASVSAFRAGGRTRATGTRQTNTP